jgi:hypothetical protein
MSQPSLFICSSTAGADIAEALQANLSNHYEVQVWNQGTFGLSEHILKSLTKASRTFDFAILVLTPDEVTTSNTTSHASPRDNVIFELGFLLGVLGRERTFMVYETSSGNSTKLELPAYVNGLTYAKFSRSNRIDLRAALGPATISIREALRDSLNNHDLITGRLVEEVIQRTLMVICRSLAMPLSPDEAKLRAFIFKKKDEKLVCTHYWAPYAVVEATGITFEINAETEKQVAVVKAAQRKQVCAVSVSVLPDNMDGIQGNVDKDLCFILAAPILNLRGDKIWGTVDIDASNPRGEYILRNEMSRTALFELGKILYLILARSV